MADLGETKVALVTGSSTGIGEATVKLFSQQGYNVVICGKEKAERVADECAKVSPKNLKPLSLVLDFSVPENGELAVKKTVEHFGRLDVLVNNAGMSTPTDSKDPTSYDIYRQIMTVNTDATVRASLAAVEHLKATRGSIIFVASVASSYPFPSVYAYCMSKAAVSTFAKCLAIDVSPDIRVNIVSPGPVKTAIYERFGLNQEQVAQHMAASTLLGRVAEGEEIANAIYFLVSDKASFIHGHELFVDGGYLINPSGGSASLRAIGLKESQ